MLPEAANKLLDELKELREFKKSKKTMKQLNYRFKDSARAKIKDLSFNLSTENHQCSESDVARAAMYLGLKQLEEVYDHNKNQANGLMHIIKIKMKLFNKMGG